MKSPIDELNENNEFYNDYILFNNLNNIVIEIIDLNNNMLKNNHICIL